MHTEKRKSINPSIHFIESMRKIKSTWIPGVSFEYYRNKLIDKLEMYSDIIAKLLSGFYIICRTNTKQFTKGPSFTMNQHIKFHFIFLL